MNVHGHRISLVLGLLMAPCIGFAQQLDNTQIMTTLGQVKAAAPAVDVALLVEEANANVGKGIATLPNWNKLSELSQLIVEIDFENNSTAIEPKSYRTVGLIADALHHPDLFRYKFLIVGHSSATGTAKRNLELSQKRADAINEALSTTFAVSPDRLFSVGAGEEWPIDPGHPESSDNRRVQLINLGLLK
ncbi:OmpA family protein [Rhizobium ruizarguesonis]|uniref:OmpA family protein n=1 Tax=Rhizobium ruizarguesonis TaxID=2081791 RepID=UPI00102F8666|nr:OmpA family protein [Rhizobium ruizarguesonis]TAU37600.1 OmpA family protein [Rhizobium ruizarguesonis]TAU46295.1 OmpA family protein [Rhizobium ruizarguesonis]TAU93452.1 OmpA family protein [Rhizobium ruizarguesonis]